MLRNSRFEAEEIEREKGVIIEEMNMYFDTPRDFIGGVYEQLLYGDQPLGRDIIGRKETVRGATRDTFMGYLDRWYKPSRMVLGVAGRIGDGLARARAGAARRPRRRRDRRAGAHRRRTRTAASSSITKQSEQAHVVLGVPSLPLDHPDRYAIQLLATALGGGMSSRLFSEVRERRGLAYYVYGLNHSYTDAGTLYSQAGVDINRIDDAVATIAAELRKVAAEPLPPDELEKARNFAKGRFVLSLESPQGLSTVRAAERGAESGRSPTPTRCLRESTQSRARTCAGRVGADRERSVPARSDRPVRRRLALRAAARRLASGERTLAQASRSTLGGVSAGVALRVGRSCIDTITS